MDPRVVRAVAAVILLAVGALIGYYIAHQQADDAEADLIDIQTRLGVVERALTQSEQRNWEYYQTVEVLTAENERLRAGDQGPTEPGGEPVDTTAPVVLGRAYGDGTYLIGEDILPGTYNGAVVGETGYWARLKGTDGAVGSIVANGIERGPFVLTIIESDKAVELRGVEITER